MTIIIIFIIVIIIIIMIIIFIFFFFFFSSSSSSSYPRGLPGTSVQLVLNPTIQCSGMQHFPYYER
jgi:flagellar basal body-associated protein FliL